MELKSKISLIIVGILIVAGAIFFTNTDLIQGFMKIEKKIQKDIIPNKMQNFENKNNFSKGISKTLTIPYLEPLIQHEIFMENDSGQEFNVEFSIGEIYEFDENNFIRLDTINGETAHFSIWNNDGSGCRLADPAIFLKNLDNHEKYSFYLDWFFEVQAINVDSVVVSFYTGDIANEICNEAPLQLQRCLAFHPIGTYKIQTDNFARYFDTKANYGYNNLMLNYTEALFEKLESLFPNLSSIHPYGDRWNFIVPETSESTADSAWQDTAVIHVSSDNFEVNQLLTDFNSRNTYAEKIENDDLNFEFSTETHEWTHLFLYPTELGRVPNPGGETSKLAEGIADYIQTIAKYYPADGPRYAYCGETGFLPGRGIVLDGLSYIEAFSQGYSYDTGDCFFKKVENTCGLDSIDAMFSQLWSHQYDPFSNHSNLFRIIKNNCASSDEFDQIMDNFGFSLDLLDEIYQPGAFIPIKEMACEN